MDGIYYKTLSISSLYSHSGPFGSCPTWYDNVTALRRCRRFVCQYLTKQQTTSANMMILMRAGIPYIISLLERFFSTGGPTKDRNGNASIRTIGKTQVHDQVIGLLVYNAC